MSEADLKAVRFWEDPDYFRAAVRFTSQVTTFAPRLVEKDYSCTMLLEYLSDASDGLVFKGGTCLSKVHGDFYRLSEDLDFVVPMPADAPRFFAVLHQGKVDSPEKAVRAAIVKEFGSGSI